MTENKKTPNAPNRRVHMANERTFLAWTRTSIGIMAFGFVVERFAFFLKQMSYILGKDITLPQYKYSSVMGIVLVGFGVLMGVLSFIRYRKIERQIDDGIYQPSLMLDAILTIAVLTIGIFLLIYLARSI